MNVDAVNLYLNIFGDSSGIFTKSIVTHGEPGNEK